jgi:hypothetical protein
MGAQGLVLSLFEPLKYVSRERYIPPVPAPKKPDDQQFKVGDRVTVSLSAGRVVDGVVKVIINRADGVRLQVDYGKDETALVYLWQVRSSDA